MKKQWIVFFHEGKELCRYTVSGTFAGERDATIQLLAYENDIPASEITFAIVTR